MAKKHYTSLGDQIDMSALAARHASTVALGNAKMNARGDILNSKGVVLRTQEQIEEEWRKVRERQEEISGIPANIKEPIGSAIAFGKKLTDDQDFDPSNMDERSHLGQQTLSMATNGEMIKDLVDRQQPSQGRRPRKVVDAD